MVKSKNYWFKPAKGTDRLTIASRKGFALILAYAIAIGLMVSFISLWIDEGNISAWFGIPVVVVLTTLITGTLLHIAISHSKYGKKAKK